MKNSIHRISISLLTLTLGGMFVFSGCKSDSVSTSKAGTTYGTKVRMGQDSATTFVTTNDTGDVTAIGVTFPSKAMNGIPATPDSATFMIPFPTTAPAPWTFAMINWNAQGHPPAGIYTKPHFDFHFYLQSMSEVMNIAPGKETMFPEAKNFPAGYVTDSTIIPMMGTHWGDPTGPEFTGGTFTKTFIYGSYHGDVTFYEPMITRQYLDGKTDSTFAIKQPTNWQKTGMYPTSYHVKYDAATDSYWISLEGLTQH